MSTQTTTGRVAEKEAVLRISPSDLAAHIKPAEELLPQERETYLHLSNGSDAVRVTTTEKGFALRLVRHPEFRLSTINGSDVSNRTLTRSLCCSFAPIVQIEGELPVTHLKVLSNGREQLNHSHVITDEVYGGEQR
ncbi:hypothetical protein [Halobellus ordinarius]|uniref:hypothetical protein n=1 Tax=Halobellus ordinarius TaxID=3075120 RepID=UPI00288024DA|nr:hypothetical protein [Halobellus sp. ZY16]